MGVDDRDWQREPRGTRSVRLTPLMGALILVGVICGLGLTVVVRSQVQGASAAYGGEQFSHAGATKIKLLPGLPSIKIGSGDALYARDDPWARYLADEQACPGGENVDAPLAEQANTMVCLVNFARQTRGLPPVSTLDVLNRSAVAKAARIERCRDFNHSACGQDAADDIRALGYRGAWGENLFIAGGRYGAPRPTLDGWLNSPGHRENLFRPEWRFEGIAVQKLDRFGRETDMTLWVNQFGDR